MTVRLDWKRIDATQRAYYMQQPTDAYRTFRVKKALGGERCVQTPAPALKSIQSALLKQLKPHLRLHVADHCTFSHSTVTHARLHAGAGLLLTMDAANFYTEVPMQALWHALSFWRMTTGRLCDCFAPIMGT